MPAMVKQGMFIENHKHLEFKQQLTSACSHNGVWK